MNIFSERIKILREERGLTQTQLAELTNLSQAAIAKWETGDRTPCLDSLIALSKFFGCSVDYIVGLEN